MVRRSPRDFRALTIGELMFFYTLLGYLLAPLERLATVNLQIQDALVAIDRLFQVLDLPAKRAASAKRHSRASGRRLSYAA